MRDNRRRRPSTTDALQGVLQRCSDALANVPGSDGLALELARRTPRVVGTCLIFFLAGVVASRMNLWAENSLWGIPSLGMAGVGVGFWIWSANLVLRPDLSAAGRRALQRAMYLQSTLVAAALIGVCYFGGMALGIG